MSSYFVPTMFILGAIFGSLITSMYWVYKTFKDMGGKK